ncbi:MAG: molybdopterin molybdotransferase MoeA [Gemmatimonadales bacterium]|jgi:molybdopterin molybdotransferase
MSPTPTRIPPRQAAESILAALGRVGTERVALPSAAGRVLAASAVSPVDVPAWDYSALDGYAVRDADLTGDDIILRVVDTIPAGGFPTRRLDPGECARIFTGAPVPTGADSVIRQEHVTVLDDERVRIDDRSDVRRNIRRRGEDISRGSTILEAGTALEARHLGVLASMVQTEVGVYRRPLLAVLATGDELADLNQRQAILEGRKVASSNSYTMRAAGAAAGAVVHDLGIAPDDPDDLRRRLTSGRGADLIVTSAGMSVGEHDHLRAMLEDLGDDMGFWRLRMRPGAPVGFGTLDGTPWIGLPGNPVSTMVTFELFVRPALRVLGGHTLPFRRTVPVQLGAVVETPGQLTHFVRVRLTVDRDGLVAHPTGPQSSGILTSMARADALLIVPEERERAEAGETLRAIVLEDGIHVKEPPF